MMGRGLMITMVFVLMMRTSTTAQETSGAAADSAAIVSLIEAVETANNAGDVDTWVGLFSADAVYMPPGAPAVTTRKELVEIARAGFRYEADVRIQPLEIRVAGDLAIARNRVTGDLRLADSGEVISIDVKQLVVYARQAGGWRISRMISNSNRYGSRASRGMPVE